MKKFDEITDRAINNYGIITAAYTGALETIADRTDILPTIDDAVDWVNDLIAKIAAS